jgi:hypothetical protein
MLHSRWRGNERSWLPILCGLALAAAALALLPASASAQLPMSMSLAHDKPAPTPEQIEKQRALDKAYKAATQKIPEKNNAADPWGSIRPAPGASANAKSAKKGKP